MLEKAIWGVSGDQEGDPSFTPSVSWRAPEPSALATKMTKGARPPEGWLASCTITTYAICVPSGDHPMCMMYLSRPKILSRPDPIWLDGVRPAHRPRIS